MEINAHLINFLNNSKKISHCNILLCDKSKFIFTSLYDEKDIFTNNNISNELKTILDSLSTNPESSYTTIAKKNPCIKLIGNEDIPYTAQIILPVSYDKLGGCIVFFSTDRNYLESNLRFARTTKFFTEKLFKECSM